MKFLNTLASYVPSIILDQLQEQGQEEAPFRKAYETVVVFCDISGFTKLTEHMAKTGKGAEGVSRSLNKCVSRVPAPTSTPLSHRHDRVRDFPGTSR